MYSHLFCIRYAKTLPGLTFQKSWQCENSKILAETPWRRYIGTTFVFGTKFSFTFLPFSFHGNQTALLLWYIANTISLMLFWVKRVVGLYARVSSSVTAMARKRSLKSSMAPSTTSTVPAVLEKKLYTSYTMPADTENFQQITRRRGEWDNILC